MTKVWFSDAAHFPSFSTVSASSRHPNIERYFGMNGRGRAYRCAWKLHHAPDLIATSAVFNARTAATLLGGFVVGHDLILFDAFWHFLPGLPNHLQPGRAGLGCSKGGRMKVRTSTHTALQTRHR
jgi:hypothetical protein